MEKETKIYLVRHGQTLFNLLKRTQGWCDSPLTNEGINIARLCGIGLSEIKFDASYSSDLLRAKKTLQIILEQNKNSIPNLIENENLRELCFGDLEGDFDYKQKEIASKVLLGVLDVSSLERKIKSNEFDLKQILNAALSTDKSGLAESYEDLEKRAKKAILEIADQSFKQKAKNVLIVSHGVTILSILNSIDPLVKIKGIANASVSILSYNGKDINIDKVATLEFVEKATEA